MGMRIAALHLPSFPLQVAVRGNPALRGAPVAVVERTGVIVACSRAAAALGVRPGLRLTAALVLAPALVATPRDAAAERRALDALGEALLAHAERVELGGEPAVDHAVFAATPARSRGATVGARLAAAAAAQGLRVRVGVADDRFTAWAAAAWRPRNAGAATVVSVPRGGSAAFLAPLPLSLLALGPEVRRMLELGGVRTLGEFAALPPPSVSHPAARYTGADDYQALARGDGSATVASFTPAGPVVERLAVAGAGGAGGGLGAGLGELARRVAGRLAGRGGAAAGVVVRGAAGAVAIALAPPLVDERDLADALGSAAEQVAGGGGWLELEVDRLASPPISDGVPMAVVDAGSAPMPAMDPTPFSLTSPEPRPLAPRGPHRRTQRGKRRERREVREQARLFAVR